MKRIMIMLLAGLVINVQAAENTYENRFFIFSRLAYGPTPRALAQMEKSGIDEWIAQQLQGGQPLPAAVQDSMVELDTRNPEELSLYFRDLRKLVKDNEDSQELKKRIRQEQQDLVYQQFKREALQAIYSPNQLQEKMAWFWGNHFSVYAPKAQVGIFIPDYMQSIHEKALTNFKDLLLLSMHHPAMQMYLDNFQNTAPNSLVNRYRPAEKILGLNENYARELLELHTLGQGNAYTQKDVQELARILTGFGIRKLGESIANAQWAQYAVQKEMFFFDPRRHDYADKVFLGHTIKGTGYDELEQVAQILASHPATAKFISNKLAVYFLSDQPSEAIVGKMSSVFRTTRGDIASVLKVLFQSKEFWGQARQPSKFKLPHQYVYSSLRLLYADHSELVSNFKPIMSILNNLGQAPYGKVTPDGYGLKAKDWLSSDQMQKRLSIANQLTNPKTPLFSHETAREDILVNKTGLPDKWMPNPVDMLEMMEMFQPILSPSTLSVVAGVKPQEKAALLLSSPQWMNY